VRTELLVAISPVSGGGDNKLVDPAELVSRTVFSADCVVTRTTCFGLKLNDDRSSFIEELWFSD